MSIIEKENAELKHVLPKVYAKPNLDKASLDYIQELVEAQFKELNVLNLNM